MTEEPVVAHAARSQPSVLVGRTLDWRHYQAGLLLQLAMPWSKRLNDCMRHLRLLLLVLITGLMHGASAESGGDHDSALDYLNALRRQAGLPALAVDPELERAAVDHARYLSRHGGNPHRQQPGRSGFTGREADDRALAAGYPSRAVSENVSRGQRDAGRSIDDLLSALYHRFGFLDGTMTHIGIGQGLGGARAARTFVYLMGNQHQRALCEAGEKADRSARFPQGFYDQVCADGRKVDTLRWGAAGVRPLRNVPDIVVWPPAGSDHALPAFYDEIPDPLPLHKVSGAVVSVQFNAFSFSGAVALRRFDLWEQASGRKLPPLLVMHQGNDPHGKLSVRQFALFPLERLRWGQAYRAEFEYEYEGKTDIVRWQFRTRSLPHPLVAVGPAGGSYALRSGQTTAVVIAPGMGRELFRDVRWKTPKGMRVDVAWEDDNTLLVRLQGKPCTEVMFRFANGFRLTLVEVPAAAADGRCSPASGVEALVRPPQQVIREAGRSVLLPEVAQRGNRIQGKGERFIVRSGKRYIFSVNPTMLYPQLGSIKYRASETAGVEVERLSEHSLAIRVSGRSGEAVTVDLGDGRYFNVEVE